MRQKLHADIWAPRYLVRDSFIDSNGTALASHVPQVDVAKNGWVENAGSWAITGNQAYVDTKAASDQFATVDCEDASVTIQVELTITDDGAASHKAGIAFRYVDSTNWWIFMQEVNTDYLVLGKYTTAGGFSAEQLAANAWTSGTKELRVVLNGNSIVCKLDGSTIFTETDADHKTATKHGLFNYNTITQRFDNFKIWKS